MKNLMLGEKNELHNRAMHISGQFVQSAKVDIQSAKVDIQSAKVDIQNAKVDIQKKLRKYSESISEKTICHAVKLYSRCGRNDYFGRSLVEQITGLKSSGASKLIRLLLDSDVIEQVQGHGKGKYHFL